MTSDQPASSAIRAAFSHDRGSTFLGRVFETGALRLRPVRGPTCEALIVNIGGGIVGGDRLALDFALASGAAATITSVAAEKVYRAAGAAALVDTRLTLAAGASLDWVPQETILFDGCRLQRSLSIDVAADARLVAAETVVFGRLASDETAIAGAFRDSWRVRRAGRLVFADATCLQGSIGSALDRPAVAGGSRAAALLLAVTPRAESLLEALREAMAPFLDDDGSRLRAGASTRDGILVARMLAHSPERLHALMIAALGVVREAPLPRVWT